MNDEDRALSALVARAAPALAHLHRERLEPAAARRTLDELCPPVVGARRDLVWERSAYTEGWSYALLVRGETACFSLGYARDQGLIWPLMRAHHARESDVVRVNGRALDLSTAVALLDPIWGEARVMTRFVDVCLIEDEADRRGLSVSDAELAAELESFRRKERLFTADSVTAWLAARGMTQSLLEQRLVGAVLEEKLIDAVTGADVERHFAEQRASLDRARVARLTAPDPAAAEALWGALSSGRRSFFEVAAEAAARGDAGRTFLTLWRGRTPAARAEALFSAAPGTVLPPAKSGGGLEVVMVLEVVPATLEDPAVRAAVRRALFDRWLASARSAAHVEWYWGQMRPVTEEAES